MLTPQDDLLGHQTPGNFTDAGGGDVRFTERYWYTAHPVDGSALILDAGFGYYPNRGVMDAFAGITIGRRQINFRASRRLGLRPLDTEVGPLSLWVDLRTGRHQLALRENASGLSFELVFEPSLPAAQEKQSRRERKGVLEEDLARVAQFGRWSGWLVADGQRHELRPDTWWGQRDRSWGIRSEMRTDHDKPPVQQHAQFLWTWSMFQFEDCGVSVFLKEREPGHPYYLSCSEVRRGPDGQVTHREATAVRHDITWADDPLGQTIREGVLDIEFTVGPPRRIRFTGLPARFYLKGGNYGGFAGWNHGDDRGEYAEAHDVWDLDDPAVRFKARTLSDHVMRVESEGATGIGISEYGVAAGYPLYPAPQQFPAL